MTIHRSQNCLTTIHTNIYKCIYELSYIVIKASKLQLSMEVNNVMFASQSIKENAINSMAPLYQGNNVRKVNCCSVFSAYILKPVLSGR